jgi:hypothetical protein
MRKLFKGFLAVAALASILTISSCKKECDPGYSGDKCEDKWSTAFAGSYQVSEACNLSGNFGPYSATITESSSDVLKILLNNFGDFAATITVNGTLDDENSFTIPSQTASGYTINGSGSKNGDVITITYTVSDGSGTSESCTATWTKQ